MSNHMSFTEQYVNTRKILETGIATYAVHPRSYLPKDCVLTTAQELALKDLVSIQNQLVVLIDSALNKLNLAKHENINSIFHDEGRFWYDIGCALIDIGDQANIFAHKLASLINSVKNTSQSQL